MRKVNATDGGEGGVEWVYVARCGAYFKIGHSLDPLRRIASLQTGNPRPVELVAMARGGRGAEDALHRLWAMWRVAGEWFAADVDFDWLLEHPDLFELVIAEAESMEDHVERWRALQADRKPVPTARRRERRAWIARWPPQLVDAVDRVAAGAGMSRNAWLEAQAQKHLGTV